MCWGLGVAEAVADVVMVAVMDADADMDADAVMDADADMNVETRHALSLQNN